MKNDCVEIFEKLGKMVAKPCPKLWVHASTLENPLVFWYKVGTKGSQRGFTSKNLGSLSVYAPWNRGTATCDILWQQHSVSNLPCISVTGRNLNKHWNSIPTAALTAFLICCHCSHRFRPLKTPLNLPNPLVPLWSDAAAWAWLAWSGFATVMDKMSLSEYFTLRWKQKKVEGWEGKGERWIRSWGQWVHPRRMGTMAQGLICWNHLFGHLFFEPLTGRKTQTPAEALGTMA